MTSSIITQQLQTAYVLLLTGSSEPVRFARGIQGLALLLCSFPAGCAADLLRRDRILSLAGVVGAAAALTTGIAVEFAYLPLIYASSALWGIFLALCNPALEAIFADSVPAGQRSLPFTLKHAMLNVAMVMGPLSGVVLLWKYDDVRNPASLRPVLMFASFLAAVSMGMLFQFNDDFAIENRQRVMAVERELWSIERHFDAEDSDCVNPDGVEVRPAPPRPNAQLTSLRALGSPSELSRLLHSPTSPSRCKSPRELESSETDVDQCDEVADPTTFDSDMPPSRPTSTCFGLLDTSSVPYLLFASDFVVSNGTGMAANIFSLFFLKELELSPISVQVLFVLQPMCVAVCSLFAQFVSTCSGRMPVVVACRAVGTICLFLMTVSKQVEHQGALFLASGALMQCTNPLRQSLLMDFVSKKYRARWNSLEGLSMFSWTGSAVVSGLVVDAYGYRACFLAAACVYVCGVVLETALIPLTRIAARTGGEEHSVRDGRG